MIRIYVILKVKPDSPLIYSNGPVGHYMKTLIRLSGRAEWRPIWPQTAQKREMRQYINIIQGRRRDTIEPYPQGHLYRSVDMEGKAEVLISYTALKHIYGRLDGE